MSGTKNWGVVTGSSEKKELTPLSTWTHSVAKPPICKSYTAHKGLSHDIASKSHMSSLTPGRVKGEYCFPYSRLTAFLGHPCQLFLKRVSQYYRIFWRPCCLCHEYSNLLLQCRSSHWRYINKWAWVCYNKILLTNTAIWIIYNFHMSQVLLFFIPPSNHLKM